MARSKEPAIPDHLLGGANPRAALANDGLLDALKKALAERALNAKMDYHLFENVDAPAMNNSSLAARVSALALLCVVALLRGLRRCEQRMT
jgi:putative transposase